MNYHCVNKNESKHLRIKKRDICLVLTIYGFFVGNLWGFCGIQAKCLSRQGIKTKRNLISLQIIRLGPCTCFIYVGHVIWNGHVIASEERSQSNCLA